MSGSQTRQVAQVSEGLLREAQSLINRFTSTARVGRTDSGDAADHAYWLMQANTEAELNRLLGQHVGQIERALQRISLGCYDLCEDCGRRIEDERRQVRPEATRCMRCQRQHELAAADTQTNTSIRGQPWPCDLTSQSVASVCRRGARGERRS